MTLKALLVSKDDQAAETLIQVLAGFGVAVDRSSDIEVAVTRLAEERFDQIIVDFEDPSTASLMLESKRRHEAAEHRNPAVTVAVLSERSQIRSILGAGAHFILLKPLSRDHATATLRAATALLKRERRRAFRVAVQAPVTLHNDEQHVEGILLDLSSGGMDVLAAKQLSTDALVQVTFELPDGGPTIEADTQIAWSNGNGQTGLRFLDMDVSVREKLGEWLNVHAQEALPEEPDPVSRCKLTDLSLGGCYVETESPFPQSSSVDLCLKIAGMEIHTDGVVRVMHPAHGMGIEFPARTEEQRKSVGDFIEFLTSRPGTTPQLEISPRCLLAGSEQLNPTRDSLSENEDPLRELLRTGVDLEQDDFLSELHRQRTSA